MSGAADPASADRLLTYLGPAGSFTHAAVDLLATPWTGRVEPRESVADVIFSVESGEADAGVVPLETSVEGDVSSTIDELVFRSSMCFINEELIVPITYVVAGTAGARAASIEHIVTTTTAAAQCRRFVESTGARVELVDTVTAACRRIADEGSDTKVALTSAKAARLQSLAVVRAGVEDHSGTATRMALLARTLAAPTGHDRTVIVATPIGDRTGVLADILDCFAERDIGLTAISSRPVRTRAGEYCFLLTARSHLSDTRLQDTLRAVVALPAEIKILGSFPLADDSSVARVDESAPPGSVGADTLDAWIAALLAPERLGL
ncbi:MAG: prephenate dehydratase domain-containing protein [Candidatus Nanopelagicales bacterium]